MNEHHHPSDRARCPTGPSGASGPGSGSAGLSGMAAADALRAAVGNIDIYVFDQILRGRLSPDMRILDAGCGDGRNTYWLMRHGAEVFGIDLDPARIDRIQALAAEIAPGLPPENFAVSRVGDLAFPDAHFDAVLCSAVLHFAEDEAEFGAMLGELWRVLRPGGVFFARLASSIGIEDLVEPKRGRVHRLPDGSDRFLVDHAYLFAWADRLGADLLDPIKTTNVQDLRAMTTWVIGKPGG